MRDDEHRPPALEPPSHLVSPPGGLDEVTLGSEVRFSGRILRLHVDRVRLPNGHEGQREVVDHPGAVAVLAVTADDCAVLVWQFRQPARIAVLEIPAGKLDPGEDPEDCARRELVEETGYRAGRLVRLGAMLPSPGFSGEWLHLYLATDLTADRARPDEDEFLAPCQATRDEARALLDAGAVRDLKTFAALSHWLRLGSA